MRRPFFLHVVTDKIKEIMQNDAGEVVDVYIPRKCAYTQSIIGAKDHASVQINVAEVDEKTGRVTGTYKPYALCGFIRSAGRSDHAMNHLCTKDKICSGLIGPNGAP